MAFQLVERLLVIATGGLAAGCSDFREFDSIRSGGFGRVGPVGRCPRVGADRANIQFGGKSDIYV